MTEPLLGFRAIEIALLSLNLGTDVGVAGGERRAPWRRSTRSC